MDEASQLILQMEQVFYRLMNGEWFKQRVSEIVNQAFIEHDTNVIEPLYESILQRFNHIDDATHSAGKALLSIKEDGQAE